MSRREFHFVSGASSKFWAIELNGSSFDVTYGKIGTPGTKQTKSFGDAAAAQKAYDKLVLEKTSKGYVEIGGGGSGGSKGSKDAGGASAKKPAAGGKAKESDSGLSELLFSTTQNIDDMDKLATFVGLKVVKFKSPKSIKKGDNAYRIEVSYENEDEEDSSDFHARLDAFLDSEIAPSVRGLIIGNWSLDGPEPAKPIVEKLIKRKDRLIGLQGLFFGHIAQEENEISWIENCDMGGLLNALPSLELFRVRGGQGLELKGVKHEKLRALGVETGGLSREAVAQICKAKLPNLEYLELWLGTEDYGGTTRVNDLQPILKGTAFPKLKYLGLRNSEIADEIAGVIINSPIIKQLETFDLSLGTLTDEGAKALLKLPTDGALKRLDVHRHFLSSPMMKQLKTLPVTLNVANQEKPDDWGDGEMRFVAIGE